LLEGPFFLLLSLFFFSLGTLPPLPKGLRSKGGFSFCSCEYVGPYDLFPLFPSSPPPKNNESSVFFFFWFVRPSGRLARSPSPRSPFFSFRAWWRVVRALFVFPLSFFQTLRVYPVLLCLPSSSRVTLRLPVPSPLIDRTSPARPCLSFTFFLPQACRCFRWGEPLLSL